MARADQTEIRMRIVIENPVAGVRHSPVGDDMPLDLKTSSAGEPACATLRPTARRVIA